MDLSFGKNRLRITAVTNTNATQFSANTALMILGKCANISGHCVNPSPMLSESIYPTTKPNNTDNCFRYPFARILKMIMEKL